MSPLQSSGAISLGDLGSFFTDTSPHSLSEFYKGGSRVPSNISGGSVPTSGTISLSNFYGVDLAPTGAKVGLSDAFYDTTGNGTDGSWSTYTPDVSSFAGCKVRLVWYIRTIAGGNFYQSDFAIDEITIDGTTQDFSVLGSSSYVNSSGPTYWERTQYSYSGHAFYGLLFNTQPFNSQTFNVFGPVRFNRNTNNERWSFRRGSTASGNTGPSTGSSGGGGNSNDYYMFYEGSGNGQPNDGWARSQVYTLASSNPSISFKRSMRGAGVDSFQFFLDVVEDADGNTNTNYHLPAKGLDYGLPLVNLGPGSYNATTAPAPWTTYTPNISRYANRKVRFIWFVFVRQYQADVQLDNFTVSGLADGTSYTWNGGAATGWLTSTDMYGSLGIGPRAVPAVRTTNKRWNIRSGGTPSGGTGHSVDASGSSSGQYLYYEATGSFSSWGFLASPEFTLGGSPSVSMAMAMYAGSAETYRCYVELRD